MLLQRSRNSLTSVVNLTAIERQFTECIIDQLTENAAYNQAGYWNILLFGLVFR